jgi:hypothetical protein
MREFSRADYRANRHNGRAYQQGENMKRGAEIVARNITNLRRWREIYTYLRAVVQTTCDHLYGVHPKLVHLNYPDLRNHEQRGSWLDIEIEREYMREWLDSVARLNAKLEAGACLGIGDAPGTARVLHVEDDLVPDWGVNDDDDDPSWCDESCR